MREILFRGKRKDNGEWVEGAFCPKSGDGLHDPLVDRPSIIKLDEPNDGFWFDVDPDTVGQYTGLQDKNGKRIFEGDIVTFKTSMSTFKPHYVRWKEGEARFVVTGKDGVRSYPMDSSFEYEVIGNIHDNPELLKGENHG